MLDANSLLNFLPNINNSNFETHALSVFQIQSVKNEIYSAYLKHLGIDALSITKLEDIPFFPIGFFKNHLVKTNDWLPEKVFESSGTTGANKSKHAVKDINFYHLHAQRIFEQVFGKLDGLSILALLPSYLERSNSSLVSMVQFFIEKSKSPYSGFYLHNLKELAIKLEKLKSLGKQVVLFGVTFALLDLAEQFSLDLSHVTLIETGGMKGRREEVTRDELYNILSEKLNFKHIYSEYGMTELLSQAYGGKAIFNPPSCMNIIIREVSDPFSIAPIGKTGGVNVIDLANFHTCSFIETQDLGRQNSDGTFEILGRFDNSELRGCNLLIS
jgi:phenylacetate-coenzyme A ligase PaaK-like adenylate-forming protein